MLEYTISVSEQYPPMTLKALLEDYWHIPRKLRHFLRVRKGVLRDGTPLSFQDTVYPNDVLTLTFLQEDFLFPNWVLENTQSFDVVFEDEHLLIVDKPAGMKTHPNQPKETGTLFNELTGYLKHSQSDPFIVHRLDKETSGLILIAKNPLVLPLLSQSLEQKHIQRTYHAIVGASFPYKQKTINQPIGRDKYDRRKRCISKQGQHAITHIQRLKQTDRKTLLSCTLDTGRTHQIRVHLEHIGYPILGDPLYHPHPEQYPRLMLHAQQLSLTHPFSNKPITVTSKHHFHI